ncbi:MAG: methyltransferase domain-containing protein, partial [bacterium]
DNSFDFALMVTTICFVDDPIRAFCEARRVIRKNGLMLVGFVDRDSTLGHMYEQKKHNHAFYHAATFYSTDELLACLRTAGFNDFAFRQTLFSDNPGDETAVEAVRPGYGSGAFVVISAR